MTENPPVTPIELRRQSAQLDSLAHTLRRIAGSAGRLTVVSSALEMLASQAVVTALTLQRLADEPEPDPGDLDPVDIQIIGVLVGFVATLSEMETAFEILQPTISDTE